MSTYWGNIMKTFILSTLLIITSVTFNCQADDYDDALRQLNLGEFKQARMAFETMAEEGFAPAQYQLAQIYLHGYGTNRNEEKALELLNLAADKKLTDALFSLSHIYSEGKLVTRDLVKAYQLMRQAALNNLAGAQYNVGVMYAEGKGVKKDNYQAVRWYKKAAEQNYPLAQFNLALMYYEGKGVQKSVYKSYLWNTLAAMNGYSDAEKSRSFDSRELSIEQIKSAKLEADKLYLKLSKEQDKRLGLIN